MRIRTSKSAAPDGAAASRPREGIVLLVVITLLTLFALVGVVFVVYADSAKPGATQFRDDASDLAEDTVALAEDLAYDLRRLPFEPVDLRPHLADLDDLADRAGGLRARVVEDRDRATDPAARQNLGALAADLAAYEEVIEELRCLVAEIRHRQ